jgi:hypothetical protein
MIPWGDVGVTVIFFIGLSAVLKWQKNTQTIAILTLVTAVMYAVVRAFL